jgi:heat-inducible transcriptional repressor
MVILIVNTGRVEQRVVEVRALPTDSAGEQLVARLRASLNEVAAGVPFTVAATELRHLVEDAAADERSIVEAIVSALSDALVEEREERVVLAGQANLARPGGDFATSIGPILEALEEHVVLLRLLGQLGDDPDAVSVRIGSENPVTGLQKTSLVSVGYGSGLERVASLGVLGPTRMDYPTTMASVRAVARYVSQILDENHTG